MSEKRDRELIAELLEALILVSEAWDMPDRTHKQRAKRGYAWRTMRNAIEKAVGMDPANGAESKDGTSTQEKA